jgi:hypothetical protein
VDQAVDRAAHRVPRILLDHLRDHQIRPADQAWATACPRLARSEGVADGVNLGHQPIGHEEPRPPRGTRGHSRDQPSDQVAVTRRADRPAQPEARADQQGQRAPQPA